MYKALQTAIYNKNEKFFKLVAVMTTHYIIDGNEKVYIDGPKGLSSSKLKVYAMMVKVPYKNIYKTIMIWKKLEIKVIDILFNPLGHYTEFKDDEFDDESVGVININLDKAELPKFNKGIITTFILEKEIYLK